MQQIANSKCKPYAMPGGVLVGLCWLDWLVGYKTPCKMHAFWHQAIKDHVKMHAFWHQAIKDHVKIHAFWHQAIKDYVKNYTKL